MGVNFSFCQNVNLGGFVLCKNKPEVDTPSPSPSVETNFEMLGKAITLVESEHVKFNSLLPDHNEFIFLKILEEGRIIAAEGEFMDDIGMIKEDFMGREVCDIDKNRELFHDYICPLFKKSVETGSMYQFCFKVGINPRVICCSIYPSTMPGKISSVDCVIRPALYARDLDRFVLELGVTPVSE